MIRPPVTSAPAVPKVSRAKCSRFQFECHSGECIGIYNACDGIPQCLDASDEGSELDCPAASKTEGSEITERPQVANAGTKNIAEQPQAAPPLQGASELAAQGNENAGSSWERPRYQPGYSEPLPARDIFSHRQQVLLPGLSHFPAAVASTHPHHNVQQASFPQYEKPPPAYQPPVFYDDMYPSWAARLPGAYPYNRGYDLLPPQRAAGWDRRPQELPPGGAQVKLGLTASPPAAWSEQRDRGDASGAPEPQEAAADRPLSVDRRPTPQKAPAEQSAAAAGGDNKTAHATPKPDSEKQAETTTAATAVSPAVTKASGPVVDEVEFSMTELRAQAALQATESQSAAIVLTLGVLLSAVLVVLAVCRAQCLQRRTAKGERPGLAHDADYLVNGMYL
ncbi:uncharacterized protein LOC119093423 [Pollicipes pollicipes]|uniref:uncharacterized protein LOC119093423 n=1 Tax=Pollicipes pollicipes TaxID=41117 RepID=UPI001885968E|nr:uncharacterized protein LOC119093423 [Pollicipes pollicipes]